MQCHDVGKNTFFAEITLLLCNFIRFSTAATEHGMLNFPVVKNSYRLPAELMAIAREVCGMQNIVCSFVNKNRNDQYKNKVIIICTAYLKEQWPEIIFSTIFQPTRI